MTVGLTCVAGYGAHALVELSQEKNATSFQSFAMLPLFVQASSMHYTFFRETWKTCPADLLKGLSHQILWGVFGLEGTKGTSTCFYFYFLVLI